MNWYLSNSRDYSRRITHECYMRHVTSENKCPYCKEKVPNSVYYFFLIDKGFDIMRYGTLTTSTNITTHKISQ